MASIFFLDVAMASLQSALSKPSRALRGERRTFLFRLTPWLEEVDVTRKSRYRVAGLTVGLILAFASLCTSAPAALDLAVGPRKVVPSQPVSACNSAAKTALNSVLANAEELGTGTGEWEAYGASDAANGSTTAAAIHCYPLDSGYVVTFTCAAQVPPSPDSAGVLCTKLAAAFDSGAR
jgi:hypothetical protein